MRKQLAAELRVIGLALDLHGIRDWLSVGLHGIRERFAGDLQAMR